ncbi:YraN family protein [Bordetella sp. LUAb4]|uniref:YraN family protein n=1 Tax=Bordetella sp. LUAb4 TaxID=2843195 RepID=UPI001E53A7E8|nr:YraN family protein [Bordetella sp. LUAb4]
MSAIRSSSPTHTVPVDETLQIAFKLAQEAQRKACRLRQQRLRRRERQAALGGQTAEERASQDTDAPPRRSPSRRHGDRYEDQALTSLTKAGLVPLARNLRCQAGEIDLVMRDGDTLVLVEVRVRSHLNYGGAAASVDRAKRGRLRRAAAQLLPGLARQYWAGALPPVRFDVIAYGPTGEVWLRGAFAED